MKIIQTKDDLMSIKGTKFYTKMLKLLKGSLTRKVCITTRPEDYGDGLSEGDEGFIPLEFEEIECTQTLESIGLTKQDLLNLCKEAGVE